MQFMLYTIVNYASGLTLWTVTDVIVEWYMDAVI